MSGTAPYKMLGRFKKISSFEKTFMKKDQAQQTTGGGTTTEPEKNWVTAERAQEFNLPPQGPDESESAFKDRISGALRDMGHIIEAHEAATGRLYNDGGDNPLSDPMTGIMGALAQKIQGVDYHQSGSGQVGVDVAAGYHAVHKKPSAMEGMSPDALLMLCALFGGGR